jgi:hypothetical protein
MKLDHERLDAYQREPETVYGYGYGYEYEYGLPTSNPQSRPGNQTETPPNRSAS